MFGPIRAVAIDDEPGHLLSITTGLSSAGIPCIGYWFDRDKGDLQPPPPEGGLPHLRLLLTDLNLNELAGVPDTAALWSVIVAMLKKVVSPKGGPYVLIFWTRIDGKAEEVKEMLYARADQLEVPLPTHVLAIKKGTFLPTAPKAEGTFNDQLHEFYENLVSKIDGLRQTISEAVAQQPVLNAVSAWESRAAEAASSTINQVHRCANEDKTDPKLVAESMAKVLGRIATAAAGDASAIAEPARALDAGLLDILIDQFGSTVDSAPYKASVAATIDGVVKGTIEFRDKVSTYADLNTFFQVDQVTASVKTWDRGAVIDAKSSVYTKPILGFKPAEILEKEFLFPIEILGKAVEGDEEQINAIKADLEAARKSPSFVLVELGADCDHAKNSSRTRRFLLGLEVPHEHHHLSQGPGAKLRNGALEILGPWKIDGTVKYLLISCRRFWTWQDAKLLPPGEVKYRLRASVVNKLLHRYASWSSRPGIVEFR